MWKVVDFFLNYFADLVEALLPMAIVAGLVTKLLKVGYALMWIKYQQPITSPLIVRTSSIWIVALLQSRKSQFL